MAFFDDMANAVRDYPDNNVVVEIINFDVTSGDALNEDEQATCKVRITNSGLLNMTGVTLKVKGDNGALVKRPLDVPNVPPVARAAAIQAEPLTWVAEVISRPIASIAGNGGVATSEVFTLKAPPDATNPLSVNLVTVSLHGWDADLGHLLINKSVARAAVKDTHAAVVHPL
jgi:hypothetical protein